jgi:cytochrome P450
VGSPQQPDPRLYAKYVRRHVGREDSLYVRDEDTRRQGYLYVRSEEHSSHVGNTVQGLGAGPGAERIVCSFVGWIYSHPSYIKQYKKLTAKHRLGHGIFSADGERWERARAILRPQFSRNQVSDLDLEERHVQNMLQAFPAKDGGWSEVTDLQPLFLRLTMDSASEFLFGQSTNTQLSAQSAEASAKNAEDTAFVESFEACQRRIMMAMLLNEFYSLIETKSFMDKCRLCHRYIDKFVHTALSRHEKGGGSGDEVPQGQKEKYIFADSLARETNDPIEMRDQLLSILIAGRDTTASLLSFLFLVLAQHPAVFSKLRTTILEDFGTFQSPKNISFAGLKACSYLQWCLNETLRLYPPVPWNSRRSTRDTSLPRGGGEDSLSPIFVPKGTETVYIVWLMQRQPEIWGPDADEFRPERWRDFKHGSGFEYLPFNGGPR